jgi:sec-independent protein translocase protein TatC
MADADFLDDAVASPRDDAPSATAPGGGGDDEKVMSLVDHLSELRRRIGIALLAIGLGTVVGFVLAPQILDVLKAPYGSNPLILLAPGEGFFIYLKLALVTGVVLGMPVILWQLWRFISPGLTREERRLARPWVPLALVFFVLGVALAYFVLPFAVAFLGSFGQGGALQNAWTADGYFGFVAMMFLAFGLVMEYPIVLVLLSKVGIVTSERLRSSRRVVIVVIAVVAAVATPGGDIVSPMALGVTMYLLYELSIFLVRIGGH